MVATSDCVEKPKPGNKVSKPLMEKKRRARINQCLDQLKSLLESYYSTSIRKRKLEKADILELTVKHLRSLQKIPNCAAAASDLSDYQTGFRTCLANFNHYLLMADSLSGSDHWMLSQLSGKLGRSRRRAGAFSTTDSGPEQAESRAASRAEAASPLPSRDTHGELTAAKSAPPKLGGAIASPLPRGPPGAKQAALCTATTRHTQEKGSKNSHFDRNGVANTQQSVWRPW